MTTRPISYYLAPAMLLLVVLAGAANWYVQPQQAARWAVAMLMLPAAWGVLLVVRMFSLRSKDAPAERQAAGHFRAGLVFAGFILLASLGLKLATALGVVDDPDLPRRLSNVVAGALLVFTGNVMPKLLTPLAAMSCDGARMQAFQRLAGWTWVLTGLAYAIAWLALPIAVARPVSVLAVVSGTLVVATRFAQLLWWKRRNPA
jgi:hypothetical protein